MKLAPEIGAQFFRALTLQGRVDGSGGHAGVLFEQVWGDVQGDIWPGVPVAAFPAASASELDE